MRFSTSSLRSSRRTGLALALFSMLMFSSPPLTADGNAFEGSLHFTITYFHGHDLEFEFSGSSTPFGPFRGTAAEFARGFHASVGTMTMEYGGGTLFLAYESLAVSDGVEGSWVVVGGTGIFEEASGSGEFFIVQTGPTEGDSDFWGTISL